MQNKEIREKLFEMQDLEYKKFHSGLCPNTASIIGVRVPDVRNLAHEIAKNDVEHYLNNAKDDYYEEILLQGLTIGIAKLDLYDTLEYLEKFIPKINNWAVCDTTCSGLKITKKYPKEMWEFLQKYVSSEQEFPIRFALVMFLDYYINDEYIDRVFEIIDNIKNKEYYVHMAIAWLISFCYIKQKAKTKDYLLRTKIDNSVYNKALQKTIESNRITKEEKEVLKSMKK